LLAEPGVVVQIVFYKLLDVSLGIAIVFGRCLLNLCLQLGREMHFHIPTIGIQYVTVKRTGRFDLDGLKAGVGLAA